MKAIKLLLFSLIYLMSVNLSAQRCAVLEFKAGVGISQNDVDGISAIFLTYFWPDGYTIVERAQIDKVMEEQGFQHSNMTQSQMVRVGQILNVSKIVVGDINVVMGQYNVDARVIDVETGTISATEGATFVTSSYRSCMQSVAQKLAAKIAITPSSTVSSTTSSSVQGYVDLALPSGTKWRAYNATGLYTYDEAVSQFGNHLPTQKQWNELRAECQWTWTGSGYKVVGPNGNSIVLPAAGCRDCNGHVLDVVGSLGNYWSSTPGGSENAWDFRFISSGVVMGNNRRCSGLSVRLVQGQ